MAPGRFGPHCNARGDRKLREREREREANGTAERIRGAFIFSQRRFAHRKNRFQSLYAGSQPRGKVRVYVYDGNGLENGWKREGVTRDIKVEQYFSFSMPVDKERKSDTERGIHLSRYGQSVVLHTPLPYLLLFLLPLCNYRLPAYTRLSAPYLRRALRDIAPRECVRFD